jgi:hypothetical protein
MYLRKLKIVNGRKLKTVLRKNWHVGLGNCCPMEIVDFNKLGAYYFAHVYALVL